MPFKISFSSLLHQKIHKNNDLPPPQIFIISLEHALERQTAIDEQFKAFPELSYQFFPAVNGKAQPNHPLFAHYCDTKRIKLRAKSLSNSQLGCFASHYLLWQKCVELNQPIIVLEDDAEIQPHFASVYRDLIEKEHAFEFLWLNAPPQKFKQAGKHIANLSNSHCQVQYFTLGFSGIWMGTFGYFITPQAAQKLLQHNETWLYEVDTAMARYWENKIAPLALTPACVSTDFENESHIEFIKTKISLMAKIKREIHRFSDQIHKFIYDLKH